jgi:hypothetical protein
MAGEHFLTPRSPMVSQQRSRLIARIFAGSIVALLLVVATGWAAYRWRYPYGWSHCCDKQIVIALIHYANTHDGRFPAGEATPEASLSLLYSEDVDARLLRGKTIFGDETRKLLEAGKRLTPETCDWHYVEGLTTKDRGDIAIFWDKVGLGHNGEQIGGGHSVGFVNGSTALISGADWPAFLEEQRAMLNARNQ